MISNKTAVTLFLTILVVVPVAFTSNTPKTSLLRKVLFRMKKLVSKSKSKKVTTVLRDITNEVMNVQPVGSAVTDIPQELLVPQVNNEFEELINQGEYEEIAKLGDTMSDEDLLKQLCPVVKTLEQYNGLVDFLKNRNLIVSFYVHGMIEVVKEAVIVESRICDGESYDKNGNLEAALPLALGMGEHDRVIDLFNVRKEITVEIDEQNTKNEWTSFEIFVYYFLYHLVPCGKNGMALKRFLTFRGDEPRSKHLDIIDILCQELVGYLSVRLHIPSANKLLIDLIGQSSLLTPVSFTRGFLLIGLDKYRPVFIRYAWRDAIEEGLKKENLLGGVLLWEVMKELHPSQFSGEYPDTDDALDAVLKHFSTKQELEEQWIERNVPGFLKGVRQIFTGIFPTVLVSIIIEYARPTWIGV